MPDAEIPCCVCGCGHGHEPDPTLITGPSCVMCKWCSCRAHDREQSSAVTDDFYEDDEPIEILLEVRRREPDFVTGLTCGYCDVPFGSNEEPVLHEKSWLHSSCGLEVMAIIMRGGSVQLRQNMAENPDRPPLSYTSWEQIKKNRRMQNE